jgi:hypothetical protein
MSLWSGPKDKKTTQWIFNNFNIMVICSSKKSS